MIKYNINGKEYNIVAIAYNNRIIKKLIKSNRVINLNSTGISCFSGDVWRGELPWLGNETWKS